MKQVLTFLFALLTLAACSQTTNRIKLTQLERAPEIDGSRAGMIGLSNANGDQRYAFYVNVADTCIDYTPTATGNAVVSIFVQKCSTDSIWYIDWEGRSILLAPFGGGSDTCDVDWLRIVDNDCPGSLTDSIYKYKYISVGARYVWPGAEMMVNDSVTPALVIIQGSRNARLAVRDGLNDTWSMLDMGGNAPFLYFQPTSDFVFATHTAGSTPQTPIVETYHLGIDDTDSTIQIHRYPNTRRDTQTVSNFLYTDDLGKIRSQDINYLFDSLGVVVYNLNTPGTDTIDVPDNAKSMYVVLVGAGGAGGSGRKGAAGTNRGGGAGGASGNVTFGYYALDQFTDASKIIVQVGAGGTGGASVNTNDTNGNAGSAGGITQVSTIDNFLITRASGGGGGGGGTTGTATAPSVGSYGLFFGVASSNANPSTSSDNPTSGSGAYGGNVNTSNVAVSGSTGGAGYYRIAAGATGGSPGISGSDSFTGNEGRYGTNGAGGGGASTTGNAGNGGAGNLGAGGGGGGGAVNSVGNSGAGGNGGNGLAVIYFYGGSLSGGGGSVYTDATLIGAGTSGDPLGWAGAYVGGPLTGSGTSLFPITVLANSVDSNYLKNGGISVLDLGQNSANTGDVLVWNGTQWEAKNDSCNCSVGIVNAACYGATGDGITDDTDSLQAAIDAAAGKRLWIPNGRYVLSSELTVTSNTEIVMAPGAIIDFSNVDSSATLGQKRAFSITGSASTSTSVTADILLNAYDISVSSTTGFGKGTMVVINSTEPLFTGYADRYKGWVTFVDSVISSTTLRIANKSPYNIDAAGGSYTATVTKYLPVTNVKIKGGKIVGGGFNKGHIGIYCTNFTSCRFESINIDSCETNGFWFGVGVGLDVGFCTVKNATSAQYGIGTTGYGVGLGSGFGFDIHDNYFEMCRHSVAAGGSPPTFNALIRNNYSYNCGLGTPDYDCHGATVGFVFENNTSHAGPEGIGGIIVRSVDAVVKGNHIFGGNILIRNADGITADESGPLGKVTISDNVVKNNTNGAGIEFDGLGIKHATISGGTIERCSIGIKVTNAMSGILISSINLVDITAEAIVVDDAANVSISNCYFDSCITGVQTLSTTQNVAINNCTGVCTNSFVSTYLSDNVTVSNCVVKGIVNSSGIYFNRSNRCGVFNCNIDMNTSSFDGIRAWGSTATANNITAIGNIITGTYNKGLHCFSNADTIVAIGNNFRKATTAAIDLPSATVINTIANIGATNSITSGTMFGSVSAPNAAAAIEISSTTKGLLLPRMTTTQRNAITAVAGLVIFNTTTTKMECYDGATWQVAW